ncbi:glycoside hydrolase family 3 C-terminal domain-containing protein [Synechococcus sp. CS-1328]|nr:glycoside hydrolase family 3 C-terminal domain-containing protein [Synechococcus sp. CS-1328]
MSLAEKLHLLDGDTPFWSGMVDIATRDASHRHPWPTGCLPRLGLKGLQFVDGPRGVVLEGGATTFPAPIARGATWDPDLEEKIGEAIAREARSFGADWVAAVCINLLRHPGWGRAQETYGEDPVHLGAMGAAMTRGLQRHAIACVKHFALNSIDSSRFLVDVRASERVLHELYLPHFRDCVKAGAGSVMSAYNRVNGEWCGQHPQLLQDILKTRWGFRGFVVTDFIFGVRDGVRALLAGQDLEMPFRMIFAGSLSEAVADGRLPIRRIDEAVLRLLQAQLTVPPGPYPIALRHCAAHRQLAREAATKSIVLLKNDPLKTDQQKTALQKAALQKADQQKAALQKTDEPVLPLRGLHSLAVIGPYPAVANLGDRGSSDTRPEPGSVVSPLAGLQAAAPELRLQVADGADPQAAAALAADCDAALLVLGLDWRLEGEHIHPGDIAPILQQIPPPDGLLRLGRSRVLPLWRPVARLIAWITSYGSARQGGDFASGDRTALDLPPEQVALIEAVAAANPRTVVVLMGGGAILTEGWQDRVPGLLLLWYPGQQGGEALADVLLGRVSPSGRLPFTIPTDVAHLPPFEPRAHQVTYDLWHGYRRLRREGHRAAYPFGYGLSYSRFELADFTAAIEPQAGEEGELLVEVTARNVGAMEADEVVQVYLEPPGHVVERPARVLVGFQRASLAMGEQRRLVMRIPLRRLAYFEESSDGFVLESGLHRLVVARHAEDAGLALELPVEGRFLGR